MKIVVCIKEVIDSSLNTGFGLVSESLLNKGLAFKLNPNDAEALTKALSIKEQKNTVPVEITLISIGPEKVERHLKNGLALGADKAIRITADSPDELSPFQTATLLSKVAALSEADLILTGAMSMDTASSQVGPLIAAMLDRPCICEAVEMELGDDRRNITVSRNIGEGIWEKVWTGIPAVITVEGQGNNLPYASLDKVLESASAPITILSLNDLAISPGELAYTPVEVTGLSFPRPRPMKVPTPDSALPAFYRILALLQGGISKREGKILEGNSDELADQLYKLLIEEDIIRPVSEQSSKTLKNTSQQQSGNNNTQ
jgi:electron transfer flavoprotein beta subunit